MRGIHYPTAGTHHSVALGICDKAVPRGKSLPGVALLPDGGNDFSLPHFHSSRTASAVTSAVVQTIGMMPEDRVWLDTAGRPTSVALRVEERFHRVDHEHLELTVTIDDPKMYAKPWVAMNKFPMKLQSPHTDVMEMYCSPSELERYDKLFGNPSSEAGGNAH